MIRHLILALLIISTACALQSPKPNLYSIVCRIDIGSNEIKISEMGEGPVGFSVLDSENYAVGMEKEILIFTQKGRTKKKIKCPGMVGHFDLNTQGNGFVTVDKSLYKIDSFQVAKIPTKTKFSLLGNMQGMLRIDLLPNKQIRFISMSPDFVVKGGIDSINLLVSKRMKFMDSLLVNKITEFVGCKDSLFFFFSPKVTQSGTSYQVVSFIVKNDSLGNETKSVHIFGEDFGGFMLLSYPCRYYGGKEFYIMMRKKQNIDIIKVDMNGLF